MSAQNTGNVSVPKSANPSGPLWIAPLGTTIPKSPSEPLPQAAVSAGFITSDGFTLAYNSETGEATFAWGGASLGSSSGTIAPTVAAQILEVTGNEDAAKLVYAASDLVYDDATSEFTGVHYSGATPSPVQLITELQLKGNRVQRFVFPNCEFLNLDDRVWNNEDNDFVGFVYNVLQDSDGKYYYDEFVNITAS